MSFVDKRTIKITCEKCGLTYEYMPFGNLRDDIEKANEFTIEHIERCFEE